MRFVTTLCCSVTGALVLGSACSSTTAGDDEGASTATEGKSDADTGAGETRTSQDEAGSGDDADATGGAQELGACAQLLACAEARDELITPLLAAYGEDGTCWAEFGQEACWQDCRAILDAYPVSCADTPSCCECAQDEHCQGNDAGSMCIAGECVQSPCDAYADCAIPYEISCEACGDEVYAALVCLADEQMASDLCVADVWECPTSSACQAECQALDACGGDPECCTPSASPGCADATIASCVCSMEPHCCEISWDADCVATLEIYCAEC